MDSKKYIILMSDVTGIHVCPWCNLLLCNHYIAVGPYIAFSKTQNDRNVESSYFVFMDLPDQKCYRVREASSLSHFVFSLLLQCDNGLEQSVLPCN